MTLPALAIADMAGTTVEDRGQVPTAFAATLAANRISITTLSHGCASAVRVIETPMASVY